MDAARAQEPVGGDDDTAVADVPVEVETPTAFAPQDLPIPIVPPSFLHDTEYPSALRDVEPPSDAFTNDRTTAVSSPSLSISSISDLTPTESDDDIGEGDGERIVTRHEIFYLEDGNVEVVCGRVIFRVHSPIISFSSSKLRDILSTSTLLNAPAPDGCPRLVFKDSAEDFAVLLNMIYTPGSVPPPPLAWVLFTDRLTDKQIPGKAQGSRICNVCVAPPDGGQVRIFRCSRGAD